MTGGKLLPRVFAVVNNEKEVILCLVINGLCREALFLFGGLRSSLLVARKTEPSRSKPTIKGFFDTRSRKRGMIASLFFTISACRCQREALFQTFNMNR